MWPRASTPRRAGTPSGCRRRFATTPRRPATTIRPSLAAQRRCPSKTRASVMIESEPKLQILVLTRFLHANRCPLRSKTLLDRRRTRFGLLLILALAQEILGEVRKRGLRQRGERKRAGDLDGRKPQPCGEQAVEHAFAEPLRELCRDAVAEHLLHQAVARREAPGDRKMRDDVAEQADHAERAGPPAIEPRQLPDQA